MSPRTLFLRLSQAEAVTWTLLILGMVLKYVTQTTELGVRIFGLMHGVVFLSYVLVTFLVWVNQRWTMRTGLLALAAAIPPWATLWFERRAERQDLLGGPWRFGAEAATGSSVGSGSEQPRTLPERVLALVLARPLAAAVLGVIGVAAATAVLLWVGPPVPTSGS